MGTNLNDEGRITDVPGIAVGHWTDSEAQTGCTVVLLPVGSVGSGEVRGGAPASREFALLDPVRTVAHLDAVVLTGGSAFGLAAADGVMTALEMRGRGFETPAGRVPIVPTLALYDLAVGDASVRPDASAGRTAAEAARPHTHAVGAVGAGTGCTTSKLAGSDKSKPGGLVAASRRIGDLVVGALVAVNAVGTVGGEGDAAPLTASVPFGTNTTIGVIATNAPLTKTECYLVAQAAHDGLARAVHPAHTRFDGDAFVAVATGSSTSTCSVDTIRAVATAVVARAILTLA